ncbi:DNA topoisomerase III [Marinobacterium lacunae]|uniref:DNA topoisomerase 3 n=1 Tax=Marinobacterium lacunae TaxID=1232683 RepID=A0A081FU82_9GAMM|nr:DNA topoisomerase III [Marinobacterium lacunae]KEA62087.1 DNA topoisomerase III [Marinobacterium lacunae]
MKLYIAEKPSLARAIAAVLPGPQKREDGYIRCGNGDLVSWCIGHLLEQAEPESYDPAYKQWRYEHLPIVPDKWKLKPRPKVRGQLSALKKLTKDADQLVHAGDPDREGQLLVDEVIEYLGVPESKRRSMQRLLISDLNPSAVKRALERLKPNSEFVPLSVSALARSRADWLYGINLTRALTLQGRRVGFDGLLSVGRVQTPVLGLVVERDRAIEAFVSKPFFEVLAHLQTEDAQTFSAQWQPSEACARWQDDEGRVLSRDLAQNVASRITGREALVESATRKPGRQPPPLPYNLSALQIDASKAFGMSAQGVLDACQSLYEKHRLITYPRSDCRYLPKEHHAEATAVFNAIRQSAPTLAGAVAGSDSTIKGRAWNDAKVEAHHAIIPTAKSAREGTLSTSEAKVYELIARQYLMQFYQNWSYNDTELTFRIEGGVFIARARQTTDPGWRALLGKVADEAPELPLLSVGDRLLCERGEVVEKQTQPPKPFTDATLLAAMTGIARFVADPALRKVLRETDGLGTEATRAGIIELLVTRGYLSRQGKSIRSSAAGRGLIDALPAQVQKPDLTAHWESSLDAMARREGRYDQFMSALNDSLSELINQLGASTPESLRGIDAPRKRRFTKGKGGARKGASSAKSDGAAKRGSKAGAASRRRSTRAVSSKT